MHNWTRKFPICSPFCVALLTIMDFFSLSSINFAITLNCTWLINVNKNWNLCQIPNQMEHISNKGLRNLTFIVTRVNTAWKKMHNLNSVFSILLSTHYNVNLCIPFFDSSFFICSILTCFQCLLIILNNTHWATIQCELKYYSSILTVPMCILY